MRSHLIVAGILALIVLIGGIAIFMAGLKSQSSVQIKCSPSTTMSPYQGWVEKCHNVTRTVTFLNTTKYFEVKVCKYIPTTYYETLTFQECHTATKTFNNVWLQIGGVIFICIGFGALFVAIMWLIIDYYRRK